MDHRGFTLWFTGLSGAGKSTLSQELVALFQEKNYRVEVLDGDEVRTNLSKGLTFSREDRNTNVEIGTQLLNHTLIPPHATFSLNAAIGEIPVPGDVVQVHGYTLTVLSMDENRINAVKLFKNTDTQADSDN